MARATHPPGAPFVNPVPAEEIPGWVRTLASTFLDDPEGEKEPGWHEMLARDWLADRSWGVRDRGRWVATLRTLPRNLTVPGLDGATELLDADALTSVTVAPTHRRRGLLTAMVADSLRAAADRGDAVSILLAAEWPIYGRYGYAPATRIARHVLQRRRAGSAAAGDPSRVRHVDRDEFLALAPAIFDRARRGRAGQVDRDGPWWSRAFGRDGYPRVTSLPHNYVIHEGPDGPDGMLAWTATREGGMLPPLAAVEVSHGPAAVDDAAHRDLWAYLGGLDGVEEVTVSTAIDDPVRWLLPDARTLLLDRFHDHMWLRLLDVPAALAARRYAVPGELVLAVQDEGPVSVAGTYRLSAEGAEVSCEPVRADPDLSVTQRALAAVYLGGHSLAEQRIAGGVREHRTGMLARADAMFATALAPVTWTSF